MTRKQVEKVDTTASTTIDDSRAEEAMSIAYDGVDPVPAREDIREAAMRPVLQTGKWWWTATITLSVVVIAGIFAWIMQLRDGLGSAGYNNQAFWAIYEADLVAFIGVTYGGAVVSAVLRLTKAHWRAPLTRIAEATALVTLPIGMMFIIPHLGESPRIWELVWPPYWNLSSPILWDFFAVSTYLLATMVFFYLPLIPDLKITLQRLSNGPDNIKTRICKKLYSIVGNNWVGSIAQRRTLHGALGLISIMIIPMAVSVHSVLSFAFSSSSRAGYLETIFPVLFVVGALYTGVALVIVMAAAFRRGYGLERYITGKHFVRLGFILVALGAAYLYLTFTEYLVDGYSGTIGNASWVYQTILGRYWIPFWFFVVGAGILPLAVLAFKRLRNTKGIVTASVIVLLAMWVKRLVIVIPPATEPLIKSPLNTANATWGTYHFTWIPIFITLAATAAIPLLMLVLFKFVPILPVAEMEEMAAEDGGLEEDLSSPDKNYYSDNRQIKRIPKMTERQVRQNVRY